MEIIKFESLETKLIQYHGDVVLVDKDVAELYGVSTKEINQAVSNNPDKFPNTDILELSKKDKNELVKNFDRFKNLKHSTVNPKVFTEKGLYMLATILKGDVATQTTIKISRKLNKMKILVTGKETLGWNAIKTIDKMCADSWKWQMNNPTGYIISNKR